MSTTMPQLLLVEDDPNIRTLIATILTTKGYRVRSSHDGFAALEEIRAAAAAPDIILSDLYMPGMSGFELLSVIRRRFPSVRVVAMSSAYSGTDIPAGIAADAFYEKATSIQSLLSIVASVLEDRTTTHRSISASTPIWIAGPAEDTTGREEVVLACTECLRTFPEAVTASSDVIHQALCRYCDQPIYFAIVE